MDWVPARTCSPRRVSVGSCGCRLAHGLRMPAKTSQGFRYVGSHDTFGDAIAIISPRAVEGQIAFTPSPEVGDDTPGLPPSNTPGLVAVPVLSPVHVAQGGIKRLGEAPVFNG